MGHARRVLIDRVVRLRARRAVPPAEMLRTVQLTQWAREYLDVGSRCAATIRSLLGPELNAVRGRSPRVLDFGSGLGRTVRHLEGEGWRLFGCDVDRPAIIWSARALPETRHLITGTAPRLPFADGAFDAAYAVSVFTHFDAMAQAAWAAELGRIVSPGARIAISSMGRHALSNFTEIDHPACRQALATTGFFFHDSGSTFNSRGAFHTRDGLASIFDPWFELKRWTEAGLDGFQDISLLERRSDRSQAF